MSRKTLSIDGEMLENIYIALSDAVERIEKGTLHMRRCIDYLEDNLGIISRVKYLNREQQNKSKGDQ